jgi:hypothetical protein
MKNYLISIFIIISFSASSQIKHGLLLGGGGGSLYNVNYIQKGYGWDKAADIKITAGNSSYKHNAVIGYKLRLESANKNKLFYDLDLGFATKKVNFDMDGTYTNENGGETHFISTGSYSTISFSVGFSANYIIYKDLYAGIGIEPIYSFHNFSRFINIFDAPLIGKLGYDFKFFDIAVAYKKGLLNALKSDEFEKGQFNDWQIQLFIPF